MVKGGRGACGKGSKGGVVLGGVRKVDGGGVEFINLIRLIVFIQGYHR